MEGEGTEENVMYRVPSERAGYVALWDSSFRREEDVVCPKCLETVESSYAVEIMCLLGDGKAYGSGAFKVKLDEKLGPFRGNFKARPCHLEGRFAYAIKGAAYIPGGY